jgi:O-antigen/teichoic acid export membrane protein
MFTGLFVGVWIARYLGPETFGLYSYIISFASLFTVVATLGLDGIVIRELIKNENERDRILGTSFTLRFIGSFLVLLILLGVVNLTVNSFQTNLFIFLIASSIIFQSFNVIDLYFQSKILSRYVVYANIASLSFINIIKITFILFGISLEGFIYIVLFESFVIAISYIYIYQYKKNYIRNWFFDIKLSFSLLKDSWPLILSSIVIVFYMKIDQIMIQNLLGSEAVGYYAAAIKLSEPWYFIPGVIVGTLYPMIVKTKEYSEKKYNELMIKIYASMIWTAIIIGTLISFFSSEIVSLVFSNTYMESQKVLIIHIWASIFVYIGIISSKWFIIENLQKYSFYRTLAGLVINIILNYILIPHYGIEGAAIATLFSQALASYLFNFITINTREHFYLQTESFFYPIKYISKFKNKL